jgi:hypothetical protein
MSQSCEIALWLFAVLLSHLLSVHNFYLLLSFSPHVFKGLAVTVFFQDFGYGNGCVCLLLEYLNYPETSKMCINMQNLSVTHVVVDKNKLY